ncbi:MAG: heparan-alpha-glucosaminide N-acetyltransferase domain-containing protein, partial [Emcibacteraceae bacterium]|nr:heparan-alpha-glucosaminide N-acetyltransferase domain-containing protein [Emcibacteraceae bacterium]
MNDVAMTDMRSYRLSNIDMMRGLVIIIMALDHVRDYFYYAGAGVSIDDPSIGLGFYMTRWITHFCAPVFVLLAGTSIGLMEVRKSKKELTAFLIKRGFWLVVCEFLIISTALTFSFFDPQFNGAIFAFLQVMWALGISMVIMAGAIYFGGRNCLILGVVILIGQDFILPYWPQGFPFGKPTAAWITIISPGTFIASPYFATVLYPPIQWA